MCAGLLLYSLFGALATVIMQSSHDTLVLIITALGAGQITYERARTGDRRQRRHNRYRSAGRVETRQSTANASQALT